jgi:hypothetical protein
MCKVTGGASELPGDERRERERVRGLCELRGDVNSSEVRGKKNYAARSVDAITCLPIDLDFGKNK